MKFTFGDIVVVDNNQIGVVVKSWIHNNNAMKYEVYVRSLNQIVEYTENDIERYMVRHKELSEEEMEWQHNATHPFISESQLNDWRVMLGMIPEEEWYKTKTSELNAKYLGKYLLNDEGEMVKIVMVDIDHDINNQRMNRVTDEYGNKHFIDEIEAVYSKEDK